MIEKGSLIVLRTQEAIYSPCIIVAISSGNVTVSYCAGVKKDRSTGRSYAEHKTETILRKKIVSMSERH